MTSKKSKNSEGSARSQTTIKKKKNVSQKKCSKTVESSELKYDGHKPVCSVSLVQKLLNIQHGKITPSDNYETSQKMLLGLASRLSPFKTASPFDRRVTSLTWHPKLSNVLAAGSKGGEIIWWDFNKAGNVQVTIPGVGPGGSVTSMQFHKEKSTFIYTASITGKIMLEDFEGKHSQCFLDTMTWENWFTCLDVQPQQNLLITGDTKGCLYMMSSKDGEMVWKVPKKIHKSKISHLEFHPLQPDLVVTASIDHTVKLWDMRKIGSDKDPLFVLQHNKGVNSANFSLSSGNLLLTTDQHSELRVYRGPSWKSQITIPHPHRQFQHLTPIKASWHPCMDVVVAGRYPDALFQEHDKRCIDFFDGHTGELRYQLSNPFVSGIVSLNQFNLTGDILASGMGFHVIVWKPKNEDEELYSSTRITQIPKRSGKSEKTSSRNSQKLKSKLKDSSSHKKLKSR